MIKAQIQFLQNSHIADLSQLPIVLHEDLQHMGVLTPQDLIRLDNARTLKIELYPEDNRGERILDLVNKKSDTLGAVNRLCYTLRCMDARDVTKFFENLDNGKYETLSDAQKDADKMREQRKIKNRRNEHCR